MPVLAQSIDRKLLDSGTVWEPRMGYSRAVQSGPFIHVSGCVGILPDGHYPPTMAQQTRRCVERIADALEALGASLSDVVRVRIYTTQINRWEEIAEVMGDVFADIRPANTLLGVAALIDPDALVEIEADAHLAGPQP